MFENNAHIRMAVLGSEQSEYVCYGQIFERKESDICHMQMAFLLIYLLPFHETKWKLVLRVRMKTTGEMVGPLRECTLLAMSWLLKMMNLTGNRYQVSSYLVGTWTVLPLIDLPWQILNLASFSLSNWSIPKKQKGYFCFFVGFAEKGRISEFKPKILGGWWV